MNASNPILRGPSRPHLLVFDVLVQEFDPITRGPVVAMPEGFTSWDRTIIREGNLTCQQLVDYMEVGGPRPCGFSWHRRTPVLTGGPPPLVL